MKNYRYPLITSGAFLMLLSSQPLLALTETAVDPQTVTDNLRESVTGADTDVKLASEIAQNFSKSSQKSGNKASKTEKKLTQDKKSFQPLSRQADVALSSEFIENLTEKKENVTQDNSLFEESTLAQLPAPSGAPVYSPPGQTFEAPAPNQPGTGSSNQDVLVPNPDVIIKSNGSSIPDSLKPTMPVAPTLPRAIAPPVGDMAISNINSGASQIDLGSGAIVPRLVLRQAPAREVLAVLARYAGMNLVFTDQPGGDGQGQGQGQGAAAEPTVSLDLENEPVQEVFNSVLMISGLQANRRGRTIFVGTQLPQAARN